MAAIYTTVYMVCRSVINTLCNDEADPHLPGLLYSQVHAEPTHRGTCNRHTDTDGPTTDTSTVGPATDAQTLMDLQQMHRHTYTAGPETDAQTLMDLKQMHRH